MTTPAQPARRRLIAGAVAGAAIAAGGIILAVADNPTPAQKAAASAAERAEKREQARGVTDKVTVAVVADNKARPATPRPTKLPPLIRATGTCKAALGPVRDLMDRYPTGLVVPAKDLDQLSRGIAQVSSACGYETALRFQQQELLPWQTWEVPAGYKLPAELDPGFSGGQPTGAPQPKATNKSSSKDKQTGKPAAKTPTTQTRQATTSPKDADGAQPEGGQKTAGATSASTTAPAARE